MTPEEYQRYIETPAPVAPVVKVSIAEVGREERTLLLGYTTLRDTFHVYVAGDLIHRVVYDSSGSPDGEIVVISHDCKYHFEADRLVPTKWAYPHATDLRFAEYMKLIGFELDFASFNPEADSAKPTQYRGYVVGLNQVVGR